MREKLQKRYPVSIVGAGPGDPELLTVKAWKLIAGADVVLYDCLPAVHVTEIASKKALVRFVDKHTDNPVQQVDMLDVVQQYYEAGKKVVRLKAGDALMFNGGGHEAKQLCARGIPFEMVPGITAGTAGANLFAIPLNEIAESNTTLYLIANILDDRIDLIKETARMMLHHNTTLVLYMAFDHLQAIFELFKGEGLTGDTPVVAASMISLSDQDCVQGSIDTIRQLMEDRQMIAPFTFFIGTYVTHYLPPKPQAERDSARISQIH